MDGADLAWQAEIPGDAAVSVLGVDPERTSVFVADGWGVAYAALRLRRLSLLDGAELATARLGNAARCVALRGGDLLAATDTKLFRLDPTTLQVRGRWDLRVPRFTDMLVAGGDRFAMANWLRERIAVVDVREWRVRRLEVGSYPLLLQRDATTALAYSRGEGTLWRLDLQAERVRPEPLASPGPGVDAAYDRAGDAVWVLAGTFATEEVGERLARVAPADASRALVVVDASGERHRAVLAAPARNIALGSQRRELWAFGTAATINVHALPRLSLKATYDLPNASRISLVDPDSGLVLTTTDGAPGGSTSLRCLRLIGVEAA